MQAGIFDQDGYAARFDGGEEAVRVLAPLAEPVVVVDVLSLGAAVAAAVDRGAVVFPYRSRDASAAAFAERVGAAPLGGWGTLWRHERADDDRRRTRGRVGGSGKE